jgi:regulator of protease activity HflC (stomatin/prohibitin superfamily)
MVVFMLAGLVVAVVLVAGAVKARNEMARNVALSAALVALVIGALLSSVVMVGSREVGIVTKNFFGGQLKDGRILATDGEVGVQAQVLMPGLHFGYWPFVYNVNSEPLTEVEAGKIALVEAQDGLPLTDGQLFAAEWPKERHEQMLDAVYFLTDGKGNRGRQISVLTPGLYRLNTALFKIKLVEQTEVSAGEVAVLTTNFGSRPTAKIELEVAPGSGAAHDPELLPMLARPGEMGVQTDPLAPGKYAINTDAVTVTQLWTTPMVAHFAATQSGNYRYDQQTDQPVLQQQSKGSEGGPRIDGLEEREITVRTSDGFTFPVDVRVEYQIEPRHAAKVVAMLKDDEGIQFRNALNSAVRAIFRNNAEKVRALDYVNSRSQQESQSLLMLRDQMARFGITITAVRIGNVGNEQSLGALLKTQTERELAKQELLTFAEQQKTAEQKKELSRAQQESEEEKRLATAAYAVKIAEEESRRKQIEAEAEAKSVTTKAGAQAEAYEKIALQIGKSNAALIELLKIVGERNIQITPRVLITGGAEQGTTSALFGTMLDGMIEKDEAKK